MRLSADKLSPPPPAHPPRPARSVAELEPTIAAVTERLQSLRLLWQVTHDDSLLETYQTARGHLHELLEECRRATAPRA